VEWQSEANLNKTLTVCI